MLQRLDLNDTKPLLYAYLMWFNYIHAMRHQSIIALFLIIPIISSCATQNNEPDYIRSFSPVTEIAFERTPAHRGDLTVLVTHTGSAGCSEFDEYIITREGFAITVEVFQKREKGLMCTTALIDIQTPINIHFPEKGEYTLNFRKFAADDFITEKIFVEVPGNPQY